MADEQSTIAEKIDRELEPRKVVAEQMPDFVIVTGMSWAISAWTTCPRACWAIWCA